MDVKTQVMTFSSIVAIIKFIYQLILSQLPHKKLWLVRRVGIAHCPPYAGFGGQCPPLTKSDGLKNW